MTVNTIAEDIYNGFIRLRNPYNPGKARPWNRQFREFCRSVQNLADKIRFGERVNPAKLKHVQDRIEKILEMNRECPQIEELRKAQSNLTGAPDAALDDIFRQPAPAPKVWSLLDPRQGGIMGYLATALAFFSPPQLPLAQLSAPPPPETCPLQRVPAAQTALQALSAPANRFPSTQLCYTLPALEEDLREAVARTGPDIEPFDPTCGQNRCGNKHRNLQRMASAVEAFSPAELRIPAPYGISSEQIHRFLKSKAPEIFTAWERLGDLAKRTVGQLDLESSEVGNLLQEIDRGIQRAFDQSENEIAQALRFSTEMKQWLQEQRRQGNYLMVRSTGAEDSTTLANAGGNTSKAYIAPDQIGGAIGAVVCSYFSTGSLRNRLNGGTNPFEQDLNLAVLLQQIVGEPIGGTAPPEQIPSSFVLFTNEPVFVGDEEFRCATISSSFGHGEGVVAAQGIGTDTFYLLTSPKNPSELYIIPRLVRKPERLAPIERQGHIILDKVPNPPSLIDRPSLNDQQLQALCRSGVLMEALFDSQPTDIEGVVQNGIIHFVQARPINRRPLLPTHLNTRDFEEAILAQLQAEMLVPGRGSVVSIEREEEVLFAETLQQAEQAYRESHKLVLVSQPEPANSHSVVNFSGLGVPCLYVRDAEQTRQILRRITPSTPLAACMQTAMLTLWDNTKAPLQNRISPGFAVHPAQIGISLPLEDEIEIIPPSPPPTDLLDLFNALQHALDLPTLQALVEHPLIRDLRPTIDRLEASYPTASKLLSPLKKFDEELSNTIANLQTLLRSNDPAQRLETLFHIKVLKTHLLGATQKSLRSLSLLQTKALVTSIEDRFAYEQSLPHPARLADLLIEGRLAGPHLFPQWRDQLLRIESLVQKGLVSSEEIEQFRTLVQTLKVTGAFPIWLTFFQEIAEEDNSLLHWGLSFLYKNEDLIAAKQFRKTLQQVSQSDQTFMQELVERSKKQEKIRNQLDRFAHPDTFEAAWKELYSLANDWCYVSLFRALRTGSPTVQTVARKTINHLVDVLDLAIKSMKSSSAFSNEEKVTRFRRMLHIYYDVMRTLALDVVPEKIFSLKEMTVDSYLTRIRKSLDNVHSNELAPSADFSVSAASLNSASDLRFVQYPASLEDTFTLIHQNCIACISALHQMSLGPRIESSSLPDALKKVIHIFAEANQNPKTLLIYSTGMQVTDREISLEYNMPLRDHSGRLTLHYEISSGEMTLTGRLIGEGIPFEFEKERWAEAALCFRILQEASIFKAKKPIVLNKTEVSFSWAVTEETLKEALQEYRVMALYSKYGEHSSSSPITELFNRWRDKGRPIKLGLPFVERESLKKDIRSIKRTLTLFQHLVAEGLAIPEALERVEGAFFNRNTHREAFNIAQTMLDRELETPQIVEIILKGVFNPVYEVREGALELFEMLLNKGRGVPETIEAAKIEFFGSDYNKQNEAFKLLKIMVNRELGIPQIVEIALKGFSNSDYWIHELSLELFKILLSKRRGASEAIEAAKIGFLNSDYTVYTNSLELFEILLRKDLGILEAIELAKTGMSSSDYLIYFRSFRLLQFLWKKGLGIPKAMNPAMVDAFLSKTRAFELSEEERKYLIRALSSL